MLNRLTSIYVTGPTRTKVVHYDILVYSLIVPIQWCLMQ